MLFPLRAQRFIKTKTLAFLIVVSGLVIVCLRVAVVSQYQIRCFFDMRTQRVSLRQYVNEYYFRNKAMINAVNGVFYGFCLTIGSPVVVLIATIITAASLTQIVRWRSQTSSSLSSKEIGVTKMLIALSIQYFAVCIPVIVIRVAPLFEPRLRAGGVFGNVFNLLISVMEISSYANATLNFFVYIFAGSRYRATLRSILQQTKSRNTRPVTTSKAH